MYQRSWRKPYHLLKGAAKLTLFTVCSFTGMQLYCGSERFYENCLMPVVHKLMDGETAHRLSIKVAQYNLLPRRGCSSVDYDNLKCIVWDIPFNNPLGFAAGFDKQAEGLPGLMSKNSGIAFVEIGSVTPLPQDGNEKPRVFRLAEDHAVINRYGFNSVGFEEVQRRLQSKSDLINNSHVKLGINIGRNTDQSDNMERSGYFLGIRSFYDHCSYMVINFSCPNIGEHSEAIQNNREKLVDTLRFIRAIRSEIDPQLTKPLLIKIGPDLVDDQKLNIAKICLDKSCGVDGLIISNTSTQRPHCLKSNNRHEKGGLSGAPIRPLSLKMVRDLYKLTNGKVKIIGCGGVSSGQEAYEMIRAGASLVQIYTSLVYSGFPVVGKVKRELSDLVENDGFVNVSEAIGVDVKL